jgi:hypothetical protein
MLNVKLPVAIIALVIPPIEEVQAATECVRYLLVYSEEEMNSKLKEAWRPGAVGHVYSASFKKTRKLEAGKNKGTWTV